MRKNYTAWLGLLTFLLFGFNVSSQNIEVKDSKKEIWIKENPDLYNNEGGQYMKEPSKRKLEYNIYNEEFFIHENENFEKKSVLNFNDLNMIKNQNTQEYRDLKDDLIRNSKEYHELNYSNSNKLSVQERNQLFNNPKE